MSPVASRRYRTAAESIDRDRSYSPLQAMALLKEFPGAKFDETVELHINLNVDTRKADQMLRGTIVLPHGTGKTARVAVFAQGDKAAEAEAAGADVVGTDDLAKKIEEGWTDFDVCIATPDLMATVGKLGRILGPRGKMPNPKSGTVTFDVGKAVSDMKGGKLEYRTDRYGIVHIMVGKKSFEPAQLADNAMAVIDEVVKAKPASAKGRYIQSISVSATMSPGIRVDHTIEDEDAAAAAPAAASDAPASAEDAPAADEG